MRGLWTAAACDRRGLEAERVPDSGLAGPAAMNETMAATPIVAEQEPNDSLASALLVDRSAFAVAENPDLKDDSLPSVALTGFVADLEDRDFYSVHLAKGERLYLDIRTWKDPDWEGEGAFFDVYDSEGFGYGGIGQSEFLFVAPEADTYTIAIHAPRSNFPEQDPPDSGAYTACLSIGEPVDPLIAGLLSNASWNERSLTYSFAERSSDYDDTDFGLDQPHSNFAPFNAGQRAAVRAIYADISAATGLRFTEADTPGGGTLRFGMNDRITNGYFPGEGDPAHGDSFYQHTIDFSNLRPGSHAHFVLLHEMGHTLGLKHGHADDIYPALPADRDSLEFSLMTYRDFIGGPIGGYSPDDYPQSYMMCDIAALQYMYGPDFTTNAGDTSYRWSPETGQMFVDGAARTAPNGNRIFLTVWDGGGNDTYDLSAYGTGVAVDLRPGEWTTTSTAQLARLQPDTSDTDPVHARGNIANALLYQGDPRSLIENAIGGAGNDALTGNQAANRLTGGRGDDVLDGRQAGDLLDGGPGDDRLSGDGGLDTASYASAAGAVTVSLAITAAQNTVGAGTDRLTGIENLRGSRFADTLAGDAAANLLDGAGGADRMTGGAGDDVYVVDHEDDRTIERAGGGSDAVRSAASHSLAAHVEHLTLAGRLAIDGTGNAAANRSTGNGAANVLTGAGGADRLLGGLGEDRLYGGTHADRLRGGGGADIFYFDSAPGARLDVDEILDFSVAEDGIALDRIIFDGIALTGRLRASAFRAGAEAQDASDRILYDGASGRIFYDADGTGAAAKMLFAEVRPGLELTHLDFTAYGGG